MIIQNEPMIRIHILDERTGEDGVVTLNPVAADKAFTGQDTFVAESIGELLWNSISKVTKHYRDQANPEKKLILIGTD